MDKSNKVELNHVVEFPNIERFFASEYEYEFLLDEYEIEKAITFDKVKSVEDIFQRIVEVTLNFYSFNSVLIVLFIIATYITSFFIDLRGLKPVIDYIIVGWFVLLFSFTGIFFIFGILGSIIKSIYQKSLKNEKYKSLHEYHDAKRKYEYSIRLSNKSYWINLSGRGFEIELANLFKQKGFEVSISKEGGDGGIDLILSNEGREIGVQCKAHAGKISPSVARDLLGTVTANNFEKGYLITLNGGTVGTISFCKQNNIGLWNVDDIIECKLNDNFIKEDMFWFLWFTRCFKKGE